MAKAQITPIQVRTLEQSLKSLCASVKTQSGQHIRPFHAHCSDRLVIEGGFPPNWIRPCPPLTCTPGTNNRFGLAYAKDAENPAEHSVLGGMKYKNVDVTVMIPGIGPALGISVKSTGNAFRNLTNRMEEAPGDCANIHMMYPGFVFGFLHLIRFATPEDVSSPTDQSFNAKGQPLDSVVRYHNALSALTGRTTITDPPMRYESIGMLVYRCIGEKAEVWPSYPPAESPIHYSKFFQKLYDVYDLRYAYPDSSGRNHRKTWLVPAGVVADKIDTATSHSWEPRLSVGDEEVKP